nr:hypothetical protein [Tanacetum cinerariifolium]
DVKPFPDEDGMEMGTGVTDEDEDGKYNSCGGKLFRAVRNEHFDF